MVAKIRYLYRIGNVKFDILELSLRNLYRNQISLRKIDRKWVDKWKKYFDLTECDWDKIWHSVHDSTHSYKIQSGIWEILHLNYYCSFRAHKYYNEDNRCKLCREAEEDIFHITLNCPVLKEIFRYTS